MIERLDPPETVRGIAKRLEDAGFETWCVGGAVRDALLGHPHLDWDLATAAKPPEVRKLFKRTIPVGVEFGTIGVLDHDNVMHEVTTFRRDVQTDGRHAVVEFGASLDDLPYEPRLFTFVVLPIVPSVRLSETLPTPRLQLGLAAPHRRKRLERLHFAAFRARSHERERAEISTPFE